MSNRPVGSGLRAFALAIVVAAGQAFALQPAGGKVEQAAPSTAQPAAGAQPAAEVKPTTTDLKQFAATALVRLALIDLRNQDDPLPEDYKIAGRLIDMAMGLQPDDMNLVRRRLEAAYNAEDSAMVEQLNRRILAKDPADTVALMGLITAQISKLQSVSERIEMYERFLGKGGEKLDPSVRSRLALDEAMILRETGDNAGFEAKLKLALKLDQTNKDAAALAATFFGETAKDDLERFNLLTNLLLADPFDPSTHRAIRDLLVRVGATKQAQRFAEYAEKLSPKLEGEANRERTLEVLVLQWLNEGAGKVVQMLEDELNAQRDRAAKEIERVKSAREGLGMEISSLPKPEEVRLYLPADKVRALAADTLGDREKVGKAMEDVAKSTDYKANNLLDKTKRDTLLSDEDALAQSTNMRADLAIMQLLLGVDSDKVAEARKDMNPDGGYDPERLAVIDAWLKIRAGDVPGATEALNGLVEGDPMRALGFAALAEQAGDKDKAAAAYREVATDLAGKPLGAWSLGRLRAVLGDPNAVLSVQSAAIQQAADALPAWFDRGLKDPRSLIRISARLSSTTLAPTDRATVTIQMKNLAPIPFGAGAEAPISTRFLVSPQFEQGMTTFGGLPPEVVLLDRRIRMNPGEVLEATIDPDVGMSGWLMQSAAEKLVRGRWRFLQGFVAVGETVEVSVNSVPCETGVMVHPPLPETALSLEELGKRIGTAGSDELPALILAARVKLLDASLNHESICAALAERYKRGTRLERIAMLTSLPPRSLAPGVEAFDNAVKGEQDPELAALVILTRVADFADPAIAAARTATSGWLGEFAGELASRPSRRGALLGASWPQFSAAGVRVSSQGASK